LAPGVVGPGSAPGGRRAAGGPGACAGSDGWRRAAWSGERPGRTRASS